MNDKENQEIKLEIQLDDEMAQGVYANLAMVNHTDSEFILDFLFVQPQAPRAKVRARVITSPAHFRQLLQAMADNLSKFEQRLSRSEAPVKGRIRDEGPVH